MNVSTTSSPVRLVTHSTASAHTVQVIMVLGYGVMCLLCGVLIGHLRYNRSDALQGNSSAARRLILPAFEPLLWILGATTGAFALGLVLILAFGVFDTGTPKLASELYYCGRQFVFVLVMVLMHQKSVSGPAIRRTVAISIVLATYTLPFAIYTTLWGHTDHTDMYFQIQRALRLGLIAWYVYIFIRPPSRASKRTLREFCGFTFVYQALSLTATELFRNQWITTGYAVTNCALLWAALCPLVIWRVLRADTEHWRGLGLHSSDKQSIQEHVSSQGLHVLIEMHRKLVIDFAYLKLKHQIGVGASAIVYDALLHSRTPVAAKVYTPLALTSDVVTAFSHEAALCGALRHPNIVLFYGMCVSPPTIVLVFELCQSSLETLLHAHSVSTRSQSSLALGYMLDAARAVAYLHSFEPGFLHRDIKPANFLVDFDHNVKLSDFGESRSTILPDDNDGTPVILPSPTVLEVRAMASKMTVKGTVDYMAPELINGKGGFACYDEAADVYSLAITMWDILHPGMERYPGCSTNYLHVFEAVLDGKRPEIRQTVLPALRELISMAWHVDPQQRPSAHDLVGTLEAIQEEISVEFLMDSFASFGQETITLMVAEDDEASLETEDSATDRTARPATCTGAEAVEYLCRHEIVGSVEEALRMGRMWLDAGIFHHIKHVQGFTNDDTQFYLDETYLQQPFDGSKSVGVEVPRVMTSRTHAFSTGDMTSRWRDPSPQFPTVVCACRQYGQRQVQEIKPRRRPRFKRKKMATLTDTNVLTASLLTPANPRDRVFGDAD